MANLRKLFGQRVREFRKAQKLSQEKLAEKADLHYTYLGAVERGEANLCFDNLVKIANALRVPPKDLFNFPLEDELVTETERLQATILALLENQSSEKLKLSLRVLNAIFEEE